MSDLEGLNHMALAHTHQAATQHQLASTHLAAVAFPADALARLQHWAQQCPDALALVHKQQGVWGAWRWRDLALRIAQLQPALSAHGLSPDARLAVSGAFEPQLIVLALAAHAAGAAVIPIDRDAQGEALQHWLWAAAPTHAFVQERKTISAWQSSGYAAAQPITLFAGQSVPTATQDSGPWHIVPWADLQSPTLNDPNDTRTQPQSQRAAAPPRARTALWVDEGTEWTGGLDQVLEAWLADGHALAAPEVSASATRDRYEIQPQRILASPARQQRLQWELQARLAPLHSLTRHLSDWAASGRGGALLAWLPRRIARLNGLPALGLAPTPETGPNNPTAPFEAAQAARKASV